MRSPTERVRAALKQAHKADFENPVVAYMGGNLRDPVRLCRVCGLHTPEQVVPVRLRDWLASGQVQGVCQACDQPLLRP